MPMSTKRGANYPLVKEIQICTNEGTYPFLMGVFIMKMGVLITK